jgi:hypothetical protein
LCRAGGIRRGPLLAKRNVPIARRAPSSPRALYPSVRWCRLVGADQPSADSAGRMSRQVATPTGYNLPTAAPRRGGDPTDSYIRYRRAEMSVRCVPRGRYGGDSGFHEAKRRCVRRSCDTRIGEAFDPARWHRGAAVTALTPALSCRSCRPNAPFAELACLPKSSVAEEYYAERSGNRWVTD